MLQARIVRSKTTLKSSINFYYSGLFRISLSMPNLFSALFTFQIKINTGVLTKYHSCMPSPLAPDPIRVQSCVCCLF